MAVDTLNHYLKSPGRTNQFQVLTLFPILMGISQDKISMSKFLVKSINTPTMTTGEITLYSAGKPIKYAGDRSYGDVTITFRVDRDYGIYELFKKWTDFIVGINTESASSNYDDYKSKIILESLFLSGNIQIPSQQWTIFGAWPKEIGEIQFDNDQSDQASEFTVTFACNSYSCINLRTG